jgi:hypothetical protein
MNTIHHERAIEGYVHVDLTLPVSNDIRDDSNTNKHVGKDAWLREGQIK